MLVARHDDDDDDDDMYSYTTLVLLKNVYIYR